MTTFPDSEYLFELAKSNPEELEKIRLQEVDQLIKRAPEHLKARLRGLQFQIDCKRKIHSTPLGSCIEISKMMLDSVYALNEALHGRDTVSLQKRQTGTVVEFPSVGQLRKSSLQQS